MQPDAKPAVTNKGDFDILPYIRPFRSATDGQRLLLCGRVGLDEVPDIHRRHGHRPRGQGIIAFDDLNLVIGRVRPFRVVFKFGEVDLGRGHHRKRLFEAVRQPPGAASHRKQHAGQQGTKTGARGSPQAPGTGAAPPRALHLSGLCHGPILSG